MIDLVDSLLQRMERKDQKRAGELAIRVPPNPVFCILMLDGVLKLGKDQGLKPDKDLKSLTIEIRLKIWNSFSSFLNFFFSV